MKKPKWLVLAVPVVAIVGALVVGAWQALGLSVAMFTQGPRVAVGIGAKLLCSAEYVMQARRDQAWTDVVQYSPILEQLSVEYNEGARSVTASFWGVSTRTASFIDGLGCALDFGHKDPRRALEARAVIPRSTLPWPAGDEVNTHNLSMQALTDALVKQDNTEGLNTRALLVVHNGEIVAETYAQGATSSMPLLGWSMAKSLTAIMLGNLEMRGLLDRQRQPVFAAWADDSRAAISVTDLLTMTDGLAFEETYEPGDDATRMLFLAPSADDYALGVPLAGTPGARFNYSSGTANLLSRLHQDVLGSPQAAYDDFITHVYQPMGMQHSVLEVDASGAFVGSSYFYATARDWARMGQLMLNGGELNGVRIVTPEWVAKATTPNASENYRAYGFQWWLNRGNDTLRFPDLPEDAFFANGNRQQTTMVFPSHNTVIVRLGWTSALYPINQRFYRIVTALTQS